MTYRIELGGTEGSPDREIGPKELFDINPAHPHTALGDWEATIGFDKTIRNHEFKAARIYEDGSLIFRGYLLDFDWNEKAGNTIISGAGIGLDLTNFGTTVEYSRIPVWQAIQDFWQNHTAFEFNVKEPPSNQIVSDQVIYDAPAADSFSSIFDIQDTDPIVVSDVDSDGNPELQLAQTAFNKEAENVLNLGGSSSDSAASESSSEFHSALSGSFDVNYEYTVPADQVGVAVRIRNTEDGNGDHPGNGFDVKVNGEKVWGLPDGFILADGDFRWFKREVGISSDVSGTTTIEWDASKSTNTAATFVDVIVPYDDRYNYTFDNSVDANNHLEGPQLGPQQFTLNAAQETVPENVIGIGISSSFSDVSANQEIATSADGGSTYTRSPNTENTEDGYSDNAGTTVDAQITLSRYGSGASSTPTTGFNLQQVNAFTLDYDGSDLAVINSAKIEGSGFEVAKRLHRKGNFRCVIDYANRDGNGDLQKFVESFQTGDIQKSADWNVRNRNPKRKNSQDYANHVTIRGALQSDGTRPTVTVQDDQEVADKGKQHFDDKDPSLETLEDVRSEARSVLASKVGTATGGNLEVEPKVILPGYSYEVNWFGDGNTEFNALKRVEFDAALDQARGRLVFTEPQDITATVVDQGFKLGTVTGEL